MNFRAGWYFYHFYFFFFTKEGGKWLIEASKWRCITQNEARDKKELTWTFEPQKEMTPLLCPMFFNSINSFLLLSECLYDSLFFFGSLLGYCYIRIWMYFGPCDPSSQLFFSCEIHTIRRMKSLWPINNCLPVPKSTYGVPKKRNGLLKLWFYRD